MLVNIGFVLHLIHRVLEQTCLNQVKKLNSKTASDLANAMLRAMTENTAYDPSVQMGASSVLVAVSHEYLDLVSSMVIILNMYVYYIFENFSSTYFIVSGVRIIYLI